MKIDKKLANEAKALVALSFRNGPIENIHAGKSCAACAGNSTFSHITDAEMKQIMKNAVDQLYQLLFSRKHNPAKYEQQLAFGLGYTRNWDDPQPIS